MKPKLMLTIAGVYYILDAIANVAQAGHFDFEPYAYSMYGLSFGVLFLLFRNEPASKTRDAVFMTGFISGLGVGLIAFYAQWIGTFWALPIGYISSILWFFVALGFFLVGRANMSTNMS